MALPRSGLMRLLEHTVRARHTRRPVRCSYHGPGKK
jgi:hypothetical protein